jgi:hypothetical protein
MLLAAAVAALSIPTLRAATYTWIDPGGTTSFPNSGGVGALPNNFVFRPNSRLYFDNRGVDASPDRGGELILNSASVTRGGIYFRNGVTPVPAVVYVNGNTHAVTDAPHDRAFPLTHMGFPATVHRVS